MSNRFSLIISVILFSDPCDTFAVHSGHKRRPITVAVDEREGKHTLDRRDAARADTICHPLIIPTCIVEESHKRRNLSLSSPRHNTCIHGGVILYVTPTYFWRCGWELSERRQTVQYLRTIRDVVYYFPYQIFNSLFQYVSFCMVAFLL